MAAGDDNGGRWEWQRLVRGNEVADEERMGTKRRGKNGSSEHGHWPPEYSLQQRLLSVDKEYHKVKKLDRMYLVFIELFGASLLFLEFFLSGTEKHKCTSRESNPGLYRGRVLFYH